MGVRAKRSGASDFSSLMISLSDPGMTPLLRCGLGGLAASLRAALLEDAPNAKWPAPVSVGGAEYSVEPRHIKVNFNGVPPEKALKELFEHSFRLTKMGLIDLPGTYDTGTPPPTELRAAQQQAIKKTFLQHPSAVTKAGTRRTVSVDIDEQPVPIAMQP
jgi:CRISPR-associated protein Cas8a1/Csx13